MSKIEWTEKTWNPVTGCTKISVGCKNCYAETLISRFGDVWNRKNGRKFEVEMHPSRFTLPFLWKKPSKIFVCSMSDLFHLEVSFDTIEAIFRTMLNTPQHTYYILTKRPERMRSAIAAGLTDNSKPLPNVWLGVTAENQEQADKRIPILLQIPAAKRFVSLEPLLSPISFRWCEWEPVRDRNHLDGLRKLDWIITGAESGPKRRPFNEQWVTDIKNQCVEAGVPFFYKQGVVNGKLVKMPKLSGKIWNE